MPRHDDLRAPRRVRRWNRLVVLLLSLTAFADRVQSGTLAWEAGNGFRSARVTAQAGTRTGFTLFNNATLGITFTNSLSFERSSVNNNLLNGAGVAVGDYDGDGWCDIYFCGLGGRNALYRNLGNWKFEDVTDAAGVACANQFSTGAVFADINGDGWPDLLVTSCGGPNACFLNDGHGHFQNVTEAAGLLSKYGSTSMALADVDGDGDLDLYVANYGENTVRSGLNIATRRVGNREIVTGRYANRLKIIDGRLIEYGEPDVLYLNDGHGKFTPVPWTEGAFLDSKGVPLAAAPWDMGLSVQFRDLNGDNAPDIYVCNDFQTPDRIWINDGRGHFRALPAGALSHTSYFSMTSDFADINRDGFVDFFTADMSRRSHRLRMGQSLPDEIVLAPGETHDRTQVRHNTLFLNRGDGTWADIADYAGVGASDWTWNSVFLDVDLDGFEDLLVVNGHAYDTEDLDTSDRVKSLGKQRPQDTRTNLLLYPKLETPNAAFRNRGNLTFEEVGTRWGFDSKQVSHGLALADLDNDGDLDVVVNCLNAPPLIYRNESSAPRVAVRLKGSPPNTQGIGAKVRLLGGPVTQSQEIIAGGHYLSGSEPMRVFAAGGATGGMTLQVTWRSGRESLVNDVKPVRVYEIAEAGTQASQASNLPSQISNLETHAAKPKEARIEIRNPKAGSLFEEAAGFPDEQRVDEPTDDFALQPLLPWKLSENGPGIAWVDLDGDGREDLWLGAGRGGMITALRNDGNGNFTPWPSDFLRAKETEPHTGIAGWSSGGKRFLLSGIARSTAGEPSAAVRIIPLPFGANAQSGTPPPQPQIAGTNPGPLAVADVDGDGDLDLFVGGRALPGRYPEPSPSLLFRNDHGELKPDSANNARLANVGIVNGAVFSDLDGDGLPELILACEWGPVRVFHNQAGQFTETTMALGLAGFTGWWQGVTTGDFDGDGRLDIVAGNRGLNSVYTADAAHPALLYHGDFNGSGSVDILEAEFDPEQDKTVPRRAMGEIGGALPFLRGKFSTHKTFGAASVGEILGDLFSKAHELKATTLASMIFLNRGGHFEAVALPPEAQFAPAFGICVADFDGDGKEDIFLAQNFSGSQPNIPPAREGRGALLIGNGMGSFTAMPTQNSGIALSGDQRAAAVADYDGDGRVDLAVSRHGAAAKLFHNTGARPGRRVRLSGAAGNPDGIGSVLRVVAGEQVGPAREIHAGSGHWSHDSATQVLAIPTGAKLQIRWPGGKVTTTTLPDGNGQITVDETGAVRP